MNLFKKLIYSLIIVFLLFLDFFNCTFFTNVFAKSDSDINLEDVNVSSDSCMLVDIKTNKILYAKNIYDKKYPASTTKLMTAILTLENCKLSDVATVSHNAVYSIPSGYSHAYLKEGEELTIEQLLNILLIPSANDAAIVLAEHVAGSVESFCNMMNNKAKEIGCTNTNFANPNGIHNSNHYSSAYDLYLIGLYAMKFPEIMNIVCLEKYTLPSTNKYNKDDRTFETTNSLIVNTPSNEYYYPFATGLKTGYTDVSGACIVSTAKKDNRELILVLLDAPSFESRDLDCINLFNYGFNNYSFRTINSANDIIKKLEIENGTKETKNLDILVKDKIIVFMKNEIDISKLTPIIEITSELTAPIIKNSKIGKITYKINGNEYSSDLIAGSSVLPSNIEVFVFRFLLVFLILYIFYILLNKTYKKFKEKNN